MFVVDTGLRITVAMGTDVSKVVIGSETVIGDGVGVGVAVAVAVAVAVGVGLGAAVGVGVATAQLP